jgi:large subunit ribosomal protein LP2
MNVSGYGRTHKILANISLPFSVSLHFLVRYVAAYLLAVLGGNAAPAKADLEKILSSVGVEVDAARVTKVIADLKGKSIEELIAQGREKLSSMPAGGAAAAAAPAAGKFKKSL